MLSINLLVLVLLLVVSSTAKSFWVGTPSFLARPTATRNALQPKREGSGPSLGRRGLGFVQLRGGAVAHPGDLNSFDATVKDAQQGLVVVDFSATWCMPCKMIAPVFAEMSEEFSAVKFIKVDVDEAPEVAQRFKVMSMPTFLFLRNGEVVGRFSGASADKLREMILQLSQ